MTNTTSPTDKRLITLVVIGVVCVLTIALACMVGCSPSKPEADTSSKTEQEDKGTSKGSDMDNQPVNWTMESDCSTCHTTEAESMTDAACPQAAAHKDETCIDCHTDESVLSTAHDGITFGDKPASKATVLTVPEETCIECHGTMAEMAVITADSTALTDSNDTSVNPHERPAGATHEENPATCTDCHNNHSQDLEKDAMKYCATCHHRGVFTCGNCHEIR